MPSQGLLFIKGLSSAHFSGCPPFSPLPVNPGPTHCQVSAPHPALGILPSHGESPFPIIVPRCPPGRWGGKAHGTLGMSQLCPLPCQAPCPIPDYSLGADRLFSRTPAQALPGEGKGPLSSCFIYLGVCTPQPHASFAPLLPLHALPVLHLCQCAKPPLGPQWRVDVPTGLGQAWSLVPAAAPLQWALLGLCQATAVIVMVYKQ